MSAAPPNETPPTARYAWPTVAFSAALWGTDLLLRPRLLAAGINPAAIVLGEHLLLALIFSPTLFRLRAETAALKRSEWAGLLFLAWGGSAIATILLTAAYRDGNALTANLLQKLQSPIAVVMAGMVLKERRSGPFWLFFGLAIVSAYFMSFGFMSPLQVVGSKAAWPTAYAVAAAAIWGACTVVGRLSLRHASPAVVTGWRFVLALPLLFVLNAQQLFDGSIVGASSHWSNLWPLLVIVAVPDALGMSLYYIGLKRTPASIATLAELAYPISALILGLGFGGQTMTLGQGCGLVLLLLCLQGIQWTHSVREPAEHSGTSPAPAGLGAES